MKDILVSIIIPVYNAERYIIDTLESVENQTYMNYEVILIDDKSTDNSKKVIEDYIQDKEKYHLFSNEQNSGVAYSRNRGFKIAKGYYVALLDADDIWDKDKLDVQVEFMRTKDIEFSYTSYYIFNNDLSKNLKLYKTREFGTYEELLQENFIGCSSVMIKSSVLKNFNMNGSYSHEDYAFWLQLMKNNIVGCGIDRPLMYYRRSSSGRSFNKINALRNRCIIYKKQENLTILKRLKYLIIYSIKGIVKTWIK